jgi:GxxExxY protein
MVVEEDGLTRQIIGCAMRVHQALGPGFMEVVYQNALLHELRKADLVIECEKRLQVRYDGVVVGDHVADMVVDGRVIVENKAVQALTREHEVQLVNYLTATGIDVGLLLNSGAVSLQIKRKHRVYRAREE